MTGENTLFLHTPTGSAFEKQFDLHGIADDHFYPNNFSTRVVVRKRGLFEPPGYRI